MIRNGALSVLLTVSLIWSSGVAPCEASGRPAVHLPPLLTVPVLPAGSIQRVWEGLPVDSEGGAFPPAASEKGYQYFSQALEIFGVLEDGKPTDQTLWGESARYTRFWNAGAYLDAAQTFDRASVRVARWLAAAPAYDSKWAEYVKQMYATTLASAHRMLAFVEFMAARSLERAGKGTSALDRYQRNLRRLGTPIKTRYRVLDGELEAIRGAYLALNRYKLAKALAAAGFPDQAREAFRALGSESEPLWNQYYNDARLALNEDDPDLAGTELLTALARKGATEGSGKRTR